MSGDFFDILKNRVSLLAFVPISACLCFPETALAQAPTFGWGVYDAGTNTTHLDDATSAIVAEQGRRSTLSDSVIYAIGVLNTIEVVGDDNLLNTTQEGSNTGDVSSDVSVTVNE